MNLRISSQRLISLLSFVFFFSGFSSLIYQVVWQRLLTLHYGVGSISTTLLVGVYMTGLGLGGLVGGALAERIKNRISFYFWVELGIGLFGLISLTFVSMLGKATAGSSYFLSALYMFLFFSLPTFLMGITLPLLTKIFSRIQGDFFKTVSSLYFINTIGAACGALLTSYALISFFGLDIAVYIAAGINLILALLVWLAGRQPIVEIAAPAADEVSPSSARGLLGRWAYPIVFVTGFLALGYEIVWFRLIGVLVKDSPYAFSTILSIYLLGIALGSMVANKRFGVRPIIDRRNMFFFFQFLIGVFTLATITAYYFLSRDTGFGELTRLSFRNHLHPNPELLKYLPRGIGMFEYLYTYIDIFIWPLLLIFIPTLLMGACFPLISSLAYIKANKEGLVVGNIYFFNILGNVAGSILTGFLLLPTLGSELTLLCMALVNALAILFVVKIGQFRLQPAVRLGVLFSAVLLGMLFFPSRGDLYRLIHPAPDNRQMILNEGVDAVVATYVTEASAINFINGLEHGILGTDWYNGWVAAAVGYTPDLSDVLVIGFGSGNFPMVLAQTENLGKMTVVELCPTLMRNSEQIPIFSSILSDPRMDLVVDDGRRFLLQSNQKFDLILMDPVRVTTSFANNLHSRQFFELASQQLKPDGVLLIGGLNEEWVVPKTIASVFQYVEVYEQFTVASNTPLAINGSRLDKLLSGMPVETKQHVEDYLKKTYRGDRDYINQAAALYPINEEYRPNTEFYLGLKVKERLHLVHDLVVIPSSP
jgi:predicted membrane-bound spermidine synthase